MPFQSTAPAPGDSLAVIEQKLAQAFGDSVPALLPAAGDTELDLLRKILLSTRAELAAQLTLTAHSTLDYAATVDLDFLGDGLQTVVLAGDLALTTSNLAPGRSKTLRIVADTSDRALTLPAWKFVGAAAPASIATGKTAILTVTSFGSTDADCVAAYAVEP